MPTQQSEKASTGNWSDVFVLSFWGCFIVLLYSTIPLLTILAGILTIIQGLIFWGAAIIILGVLALIGPFYAAARSKAGEEKPDPETGDG